MHLPRKTTVLKKIFKAKQKDRQTDRQTVCTLDIESF